MPQALTCPPLFHRLLRLGCIDPGDLAATEDGFLAVFRNLADLLARRDILDFPDSRGDLRLCSRFFDDWYLYTVPGPGDPVYSLFKLREQESDAADGSPADGDTPGVTVCFISFDHRILLRCLEDPTRENRAALNTEINRVVARSGQRHHPALKSYFRRSAAQGPYLIAALYIRHLASFAENGRLPVPEAYAALRQQSLSFPHSRKFRRLPAFLETLRREDGTPVCDHKILFLSDPAHPTCPEALALLATHSGNVSAHSFAAEVEYHARFLVAPARLRIPFFGASIYASAIRADMTVDDKEFEGPAPFYRPDSPLVRRHIRLHPEGMAPYL